MILVTGANGVIGAPLCQVLSDTDTPYKSVSRGVNSSIHWDMQEPPDTRSVEQLRAITCLIHCAPIWLLPAHLILLSQLGVTRIVAFSSTSVISKKNTGDSNEAHLVDLLAGAERSLMNFSKEQGVDVTILRPSMIYGFRRDQNVSKIADFIQRFGFMALVGEAKGLRQPVHALDLASAAVKILQEPVTFGNSYNLAGAETLTYRAMVEKIFIASGKAPRIISIPLWLFRVALRGMAVFSKFSYSPEMATRMSQDLTYDISAARDAFGFDPQNFLTDPNRDLLASEINLAHD
jgi:nucleoside-diphosphate-sugar epimerase